MMYMSYMTMAVFAKRGLIVILSLIILCIAIFLSQIWSARSTLQERKDFLLHFLDADTSVLNAYKNTEDYKSLVNAKTKDSLDVYLARFIEFHHQLKNNSKKDTTIDTSKAYRF